MAGELPVARLSVRVTPRSSREEVALDADGVVHVRLKAPPVEGAANRALAELLARRLGVPKSDVAVQRGAGSRSKVIEVIGLSREEALRRLAEG